MKTTKDKNVYRRMEAVALLGEGKTPIEAAEITKYHKKYVRTLGCDFHKKRLEAFAVDGRNGGNHRLMDHEKSDEFLEQFMEKAEKGQIVTIEEIADEFNEKTGKQRKSFCIELAQCMLSSMEFTVTISLKLQPLGQHFFINLYNT